MVVVWGRFRWLGMGWGRVRGAGEGRGLIGCRGRLRREVSKRTSGLRFCHARNEVRAGQGLK